MGYADVYVVLLLVRHLLADTFILWLLGVRDNLCVSPCREHAEKLLAYG